MKKGKSVHDQEIGYWESMADILVGMLLCVLLIVMLLILYLIRIPDAELADEDLGISYAEYYDPDSGGGNFGYPLVIDDDHHEDYSYRDPDHGGGGGGWGGGGDGDNDEEPVPEYEDPDPGIGEETGLDKTAVFVQIVDGETQSTIKRKGVEYELYTDDDTLQTLSVYYPVKTDYTKYETDADGVFYLPEKIAFGSYYLHGLTAIRGYDVTEKTEFTIDESRDWPDPFVVTVELYPSRNTIRIQLKDMDTGRKLGGGTFNVIAKTDVVTLDGTTRYHAGQIVDTIELDSSGYGESHKMYLGEYMLEQTASPQYYAMMTDKPTVTVQKGSASGRSAITELSQQRTTIRVTLTDALYRAQGLAGAGFVLTDGSGAVLRRLTTDENGQFTLSELSANTTYRLRQSSALQNYQMDAGEYAFRVDSRGYIDGSPTAELTLSNEMVRVAIGVKGKLLTGLVSDENVALYTAEDELVKVWSSSGLEQVFEGLAPGEYKLVLGGRLEAAERIVVRQTAQLQSFYCQTWTTQDIGMIGLMAAAAILLIVIAVLVIRIRRR